jgi:hypothetical protein
VDNLAKCLMCDVFCQGIPSRVQFTSQEISAFFVENLRGLPS